MNKKLKRMAVVGATVLMTASSVGFSNAMQVKKSCDLNLKGKMYVCINGKRFKLDLSCASIFDTLKWFNKNNCPNKFPSINDDKDDNIEDNNQNNGNNQDNNNQGGNMEDNNQGNNNQDKDDNNPGNDNNQDQDKDDNNQDNNNNQDQDKDDNNQDNNNNQDQDDNNQNDDNNSSNINGFSKEQVEVLNLVNKERKANGLKPLTLNKELSNVANIKSRDMIEKGYFDHT